jgi:cytochrome c553
LGLYLYDAFGNLELLYRDPDISSMYPIPLQPRARPPAIAEATDANEIEQGRFLLLDVHEGLPEIERGAIKAIRVVGVPAKTQPQMNTPVLGVTRDDPGKYVIGTAPVEEDGSAYFHVPAGVSVFLQALDEDGLAIQTMRSLTCAQPGQTLSCVGCHEPRTTTPTNGYPLALRRSASRLTVGPEGSWPLRFDRLVQPVLDRHCVTCHRPDGPDATATKLDLTPEKAWESLVSYGNPSLRDHVVARYGGGRSIAGQGAAQTSALFALLRDGHEGIALDQDDLSRLATWMDTYAQRLGSFSDDQEQRLIRLRADVADILIQ